MVLLKLHLRCQFGRNLFETARFLIVNTVQLVDELLVLVFRDKHRLFWVKLCLQLRQVFLQNFDSLLKCTFLHLGDLLNQVVVWLTDLTHQFCLFDFSCPLRCILCWQGTSVKTQRVQIRQLFNLSELRCADYPGLLNLLLQCLELVLVQGCGDHLLLSGVTLSLRKLLRHRVEVWFWLICILRHSWRYRRTSSFSLWLSARFVVLSWVGFPLHEVLEKMGHLLNLETIDLYLRQKSLVIVNTWNLAWQ